MITEEEMVKEFTAVVAKVYPEAGELLRHCYIKAIVSYWGKPPKRLQYIVVYCSKNAIAAVQAQQNALREIAQNMGLVEVVCLNASRLLRDPMSKFKQASPRFWLELNWIAAQ